MGLFKRIISQLLQPRSELPKLSGPRARLKNLRTNLEERWGEGPSDEVLTLLREYNSVTAEIETMRRRGTPNLITTSGLIELREPCAFEEWERKKLDE